MTARLHNNKGNKVTSALKADCRPITCIRLSSSRHSRRPAHFNRRRRILRLSRRLNRPAQRPIPMADNVPTTTTPAPATAPTGTVRITLPAALPRPPRREIDAEALRKACPELGDTPPQYVRNTIAKLSSHMYAGLLTATPIASTSSLPDELPVALSNPHMITPVCPTHILALTSSTPAKAGSPTKFQLFPTHQLVLGANCSGLPAFPSSPTAVDFINNSDRVNLPVVRLSIPFPEHFGMLQWFLYTKDTAGLRRMIFPNKWDADCSSTLKAAQQVYGIWANACALRVVEPEVFIIVEESWTEMTAMLAKLTSSTPTSSPSSSS